MKYAQDKVDFPINDAGAKWWAKYNVYYQLQTDAFLKDEAELKTFATHFSKKGLGTIYRLNQLLEKNELTAAADLVNTFNAGNAIEQYLKDVYDIDIANRRSHKLEHTDILKLQLIAKLCPYESGPAVYNARVLLSAVDNTVYVNSCEVPEPKAISSIKDAKDQLTNSEITVYPNPASDKLNIMLHLKNGQQGIFTVYDLAGKLVLSNKFKGGSNNLEVSIAELKNGMYLYKLSVNEINVKSGKLSIIR